MAYLVLLSFFLEIEMSKLTILPLAYIFGQKKQAVTTKNQIPNYNNPRSNIIL